MDRRILVGLTIAALVLPMAIVLVIGAARLLGATGDAAGAVGLDRTAAVLGVAWGLCLVVLVVVTALGQIGPPPPPPRDDEF